MLYFNGIVDITFQYMNGVMDLQITTFKQYNIIIKQL